MTIDAQDKLAGCVAELLNGVMGDALPIDWSPVAPSGKPIEDQSQG